MTKEQKAFEAEVVSEFNVIKSAVSTIATKMARKYELEIYKRLRDFCDREIDVINAVQDYKAELVCHEIKKVVNDK